MASSSKEEAKSPSWSEIVNSEFFKITETINSERKKLEEDRETFEKEKLAWQTIEPKLEVSQLGDIIMLNVGGTSFGCSIEILRKIPDTYFSGLASGRWNLKQQKDGSIFIDRDPTVFPLIMTYMRMYGTDFDLSKWLHTLSNQQKMLLKYEAEFFMLPGLLDPVFPPGDILGEESWESIHPSYEKRKLLFTSSDKNTTYVSAMAGMRQKSNMLVVSKLQTGAIVGGFTSIAWDFSGNWQSDSSAFLFCQQVGSALSKHSLLARHAGYATLQKPDEISFGGGYDLRCAIPASTASQITINGNPNSYPGFPILFSAGVVATHLEIWSLE